jgi:hypothetical protein
MVPYHRYIPLNDYNKCAIGSVICQICNTSMSTHLKLFHGFNYRGIIICNNDRCSVSAQKLIDDIFTNYPIYNLNLNRDDIKSPKYDIFFSTIKPKYDDLYFTEECIGSTYLIKGNFYIVLYSMHTVGINVVFDLKEIYENNDFSDEETSSFPDPVKEYLGIPIHDYLKIHFVD